MIVYAVFSLDLEDAPEFVGVFSCQQEIDKYIAKYPEYADYKKVSTVIDDPDNWYEIVDRKPKKYFDALMKRFYSGEETEFGKIVELSYTTDPNNNQLVYKVIYKKDDEEKAEYFEVTND